MKKILILLVLLSVNSKLSAQQLNDYKYILIPESYEFLGERDQYQLNSLTKFLFNKQGYNTLMKTEEKPADLKENLCLGLNTRLENNSGLFVTKLVVVLEDCYGKVVYRSQEGRSKEKQYEDAFQEALRDAFVSIEEMEYSYKPKSESTSIVFSPKPVPAEVTNNSEKGKVEVIEDEKEDLSLVKEEEANLSNQNSYSTSNYKSGGKTYDLKETPDGFGLYQKDASEPIALLIASGDSGSFIYNSLTRQGIAYFSSEGDLVVEYMDRQTNQKQKVIYQKVD